MWLIAKLGNVLFNSTQMIHAFLKVATTALIFRAAIVFQAEV